MNLQLMHGDCLSLMSKIPTGTVDMVMTDPPYGTTACKWDSVIDLEKMWLELNRIIKPNGIIALMAQSPFDKVLAVSNLKMFKYEWIWEKGNATGFLNSKKMPLKAHENVLIFYKKLPTYNPQKTTGHTRKSRMRGDIDTPCYGVAKKRVWYDSTTRYPRSVQKFSKDNQTISLHPTQKPVKLMEYLIKTYTHHGDTVLDFTMGSGTTGVAALNLERKFIGIELSKKYFDVAVKRINSNSTKPLNIQRSSAQNEPPEDNIQLTLPL